MQLVRFEVRQAPGFPHQEKFGGAFVNGYLKDKTKKEAYLVAEEAIKENGWQVVDFDEQFEINKDSFTDDVEGLEYYEQALLDEEVFVYHTYPENDEAEPGIAHNVGKRSPLS